MRKYKKVKKDQLFDIVCDICGKGCKDICSDAADDAGMVEYATLEALWGYCSNKDGERYTCEMCEGCFDRVRAYIDSLK
jgi:hypothetical protein